MGYNTNLMGYSIRIQELFENNNPKPTKIKVYCESVENWLVKTYRIKEPFLNCINEIMPKIKKDILEMEREINGHWFYNINSIINSLYNITRIKKLFRLILDKW